MFENARRFTDRAAAGAWLGETFGRWADELPEEENETLTDYKGEGYRPLNDALRRGMALSEQQSHEVQLLDRALTRFQLPEAVVVHRGFHLVGRALVGAEIQEPAYFSSSLLAEHAEGFLSLPAERPFRPALARVLLPGGTRCGAPDLVEYMGEVEILLPRRRSFAIRAAAAPTPERPHWALDLEVIS